MRLGAGGAATDDFKFHAIAEDLAGNFVDFPVSVIFIPFGEGLPGRKAVFAQYDRSGEARACPAGEKPASPPRGGRTTPP